MKRDPAIHITRSNLIKVLQDTGILFAEETVDNIFTHGRKYAIRNRSIVVEKSSDRKKKSRTVAAEQGDLSEQFHMIYSLKMKEAQVRTVTIKKTDKQYLTLKEVAQHAVEFCDLYEMDYAEGFKVYIDLGIRLLKNKYSIYRLKGAAQTIINYYGDMLEIDQDPEPRKTQKYYSDWHRAMKNHTGHVHEVEDPAQYVHFIRARQAAEKAGAPYQIWIEAQFDKWSFLDSIPELSQFYGESAELAYKKFDKQPKPERHGEIVDKKAELQRGKRK